MLALTLPAHDPLDVLRSTLPVVQRARQVRLDMERIAGLAARWAAEGWQRPVWDATLHFNDGTERTLNWVLLLDALNFCFWGEANQPRWMVEYGGQTYNGYMAEAASLTRALDEGYPLWDAAYLAELSEADLRQIFRPAPGMPEIPLFAERLANACEVGRVLLSNYGGQFARAVEAAGGSAVALARSIIQDFASFQDVSMYDGAPVRFYKRAQICVADIHGIFGGEGWGKLDDLDQLTIFADYKLPQVLRQEGVLVYGADLAARVDRLELLPPNSPEEVEIRAATIWAGELLRRALSAHGINALASEIDYYLWTLGQTPSPYERPYHRTRTMYY
ncbi:MAG TPA: queuosine salvage family protein [Ktedonobacterales bacterium]|nr:queuosine salvage family protein [Ktedonobacterales bacterium]